MLIVTLILAYVGALVVGFCIGYKMGYTDTTIKKLGEDIKKSMVNDKEDTLEEPKAVILDPDSPEFQMMIAKQEHEARLKKLNPK